MEYLNESQMAFVHRVSDCMEDAFGLPTMITEYIGCQFALESAFGTSSLAFGYDNYCGMKKPHVRYCVDTDSDKKWSSYKSFYYCCLDYFIWLINNKLRKCDVENLDMFKRFIMINGYCPEKDYIDRIDKIYKQFKNS